VGSLKLPENGSIYLDTSVVIYSVERIEPYLTLLAPVWRQAEAGSFTLVCSELVLAEALVQPIRRNRPALEAAFRDVFAAPEVRLVPATRQLWEDCAQLRAASNLSTADALHAVTALQTECALFITNDADFRRVEDLPAVVLNDLVGDESQA